MPVAKDIRQAAIDAVSDRMNWSPEAAARFLRIAPDEYVTELAAFKNRWGEREDNQFVTTFYHCRIAIANKESEELRASLARRRMIGRDSTRQPITM